MHYVAVLYVLICSPASGSNPTCWEDVYYHSEWGMCYREALKAKEDKAVHAAVCLPLDKK